MYHSHLLINVGDNPDRPDWNIARRWLRNLYRVHQRLCMAFPSTVPVTREERLIAFCAPYADGTEYGRSLPGDPDTADVHSTRSDQAGFLFRIDHPVDHKRGGRRPVIIVQSANKPDWNYAFGLDENAVDGRGHPVGNASFLLAAPPQEAKAVSVDVVGNTLVLNSPREHHEIGRGNLVRFRLRANPVCTNNGKRHRPRVPEDDFNAGGETRERAFIKAHDAWLQRKLGTAVDQLKVTNSVTGWAYAWRTKHEPRPRQRMQWWSVLYEGTFHVGDVQQLRALLESGIGPAKAFGFGLLSIAPVRS